MKGKEFEEFVADIRAHGLREPIVLHEGMILEGRNRHRACLVAQVGFEMRKFDPAKEGSPEAFVISANIHRRHLTPEQRRELIKNLLAANPDASDRVIAETAKVSPTTVGNVRREIEDQSKSEPPGTVQTGQLDGAAETPAPQTVPPQKRIGKDGKGRTVTPKGGGSKKPKGDVLKVDMTPSACTENAKLNGLKLIWEQCTDDTKFNFKLKHQDDFGFGSILDDSIEPEELVEELYRWVLAADQKEYPLDLAKAIVARLDKEALGGLSQHIYKRAEMLEAKKAKALEPVS
jgi:hypothetical protein